MKLFRRGDVWWGRWSVNGRQVRLSSHTSDESLAKQYLATKYGESFREVRLGDKPRRTWEEATTKYLEKNRNLKTYGKYAYQSEWWTKELKKKGITYIDELDPEVIEKICLEALATPKKRGGGKRTPADVNRKIAYLRAVTNAVYRKYRWVDGVPPLFAMLPGEIERDKALDPSEVLRLARALPEPYGTMAKFAVATGLRRMNVLRLRWEYVDLGARMVRLPHQIMKNGQELRLPLNSLAVEILRGQIGKSNEWVFIKKDGNPPGEIPSKVWTAATKKAGLEGIRWHDLRHSWATILGESGIPEQEIQKLGGWKDARMVKRYSNLSVGHLSKAAEVVSGAFSTDLAQADLDSFQKAA